MLNHKEDVWNALRGLTAPVLFYAPFVVGLPAGYEIPTVVLLWLALSDMNGGFNDQAQKAQHDAA